MKGVIVQIGQPKSIVLFNNGKISAIPSPMDAHVGMVVTLKLNNRVKIIALTLAGIMLLALGITIGFLIERNVRLQNRQSHKEGQKIEREIKDEKAQNGGGRDTSNYGYLKGKEENAANGEVK